MENLKKGDFVKNKENNIIVVGAIFPDGFISGYIGKYDKWDYFKMSELKFYKSAECSEVLQLMDESPDANYCQSLKTVLEKYPAFNRKKLEKELNQFI